MTRGSMSNNEMMIIKMDLEMITPAAVDWDKDGDIDLVVGDEDGFFYYLTNSNGN